MKKISIAIFSIAFLMSCGEATKKETPVSKEVEQPQNDVSIKEFRYVNQKEGKADSFTISVNDTLAFEADIKVSGRYKVTVNGQSEGATVWVEDYIDNTLDRTFNITGNLSLNGTESTEVYGSPLNVGTHKMQLHCTEGAATIESVTFDLVQENLPTSENYTQNMSGQEWELVWSDEFDGAGLPDNNKWSYNIGNWGWGNNEPQFYTLERTKNARQEDGNLIIEAHQNDSGYQWTSARLTTQGKASFLYGKIDFRAKVPVGEGTWAAGWLLGDSYRDELSWPACGEIDVLECVGFEIDDETGAGLNHASCHTPAYYFKIGTQITGQIEMEKMHSEFHNYTVEWYEKEIKCFVDGEHYYTYDKSGTPEEWPFDQPQNIILNLAVGGNWGGAKGIDESYQNHQFIIDYVRVYQLN